MKRNLSGMMLAALLAVVLLLPAASAQAQETLYAQPYQPEPSAAWMMIDTLWFRPTGIVATVGGVGLFAGTLPLTLITGTSGDAARAFIEQPARWTFQRRLGRRGYDQRFWLP